MTRARAELLNRNREATESRVDSIGVSWWIIRWDFRGKKISVKRKKNLNLVSCCKL